MVGPCEIFSVYLKKSCEISIFEEVPCRTIALDFQVWPFRLGVGGAAAATSIATLCLVAGFGV